MRRAIWTTIPTILMTACAASPPASAPPSAAAKASAVVVAPSADSAAPAAKPTPDQLRAAARHAGYQPRKVNGQELYCRDETPVGTRFPHSVCLDEADLATRSEINQAVKDSMRLPSSLDPMGR